MGAIYSQHYSVASAFGPEPVVIPDEAIRLRILANSNHAFDQKIKQTIRDEVNEEINEWVADLTSIEAARQLIQDRLADIEAIVEEVLAEQGLPLVYTVDYRTNVKFPTKLYGNYIYPAGEYEAILITVGEGKGDNWWCVLFPPLCFLDFATSEAVQTESSLESAVSDEEPEISFFLVELINKIVELLQK